MTDIVSLLSSPPSMSCLIEKPVQFLSKFDRQDVDMGDGSNTANAPSTYLLYVQ